MEFLNLLYLYSLVNCKTRFQSAPPFCLAKKNGDCHNRGVEKQHCRPLAMSIRYHRAVPRFIFSL